MVAIVGVANTSVTALGGGAYRIEKVGGVEGEFDASAVSSAGIAGDFALRVRDLAMPNNFIFGVSTDPDEGVGFAQIDHAVQLFGGFFYIFERGAWVPPEHNHAGTGWIVREGARLRYLIGESVAGAEVARSVEGVRGPLFFDCAIGRIGGAIEMRFDVPGAWSGARPQARRAGLGLGLGL